MAHTPAPGWYDDPSGSGGQRWWDGQRWGVEQRLAVPPAPMPPPPPPPPAAGRPSGEAPAANPPRRPHALWWGLFGLAAVLSLAAGFFGMRWWGPTEDRPAVVASDPVAETAEEPASAGVPGAEQGEEASAAREAPEAPDEGGDGRGGDDRGEAGEDRPERGEAAGDPAAPLAEPEVVAAFAGYVDALEWGDLDAARAYLAPELAARQGWTAEDFRAFWEGRLAGARIVRVAEVDAGAGEVRAVVDYALVGGEVSREEVLATFVRGPDGQAAMAEYVVVATERR